MKTIKSNNMKYTVYSLLLHIPVLFCVVCSCNNLSTDDIHVGRRAPSLIMDTKAQGYDMDSYFVKEEDLYRYVSYKKLKEGTNDIKRIIPIEWNDVTCLYVLEYEKGYEILSADKRSQVPLVMNKEGQYEFFSDDSPLGFHINTLAEDVWFSLYHNDLLDEPDDEMKTNMESSTLFWALISADFNTIQSNAVLTKANLDSIILTPELGHWEQVGVSYQDVVYDTVGHLIPTWWHQGAPFNDYCPYYSSNSTSRCPAGCVAIAAAQVLYYLHYALGAPEASPSEGYCSGYVQNNTVTQYFGSFSTNTWDYMQTTSDPSGYAALLIGDVGQKVYMNYGENGSGANTLSLKNFVFLPYGIQCENFPYYSGTFLKGNLENGLPVICAGRREVTDPSGNVSYTGHAFIVDSYIRYRNEITFTYEWVFDDPELDPGYPIIRTAVVYESPRIIYYQMNWGYGYANNYNDVWCSMSGIWQYGSRTPYIHDRRMVCNFSVIEE